MKGIETKLIVLKLNRSWQPVGMAIVADTIVDLCAGLAIEALDIDYGKDENGKIDFTHPTKMVPVEWDEWITLPIRPWDLTIRSPRMEVRVPTVVIAMNYDKMPMARFRGKPSRRAIWLRDNGVDQYTGKSLKEHEASLDHVIPKSRGGKNTWTNMVLAHKNTNYKKGNKLPQEAGLRLIRTPKAPGPMPMSALIKEARHLDWSHFLIHSQ